MTIKELKARERFLKEQLKTVQEEIARREPWSYYNEFFGREVEQNNLTGEFRWKP